MPLSQLELSPQIRAQLAIQTAAIGIFIAFVMGVVGFSNGQLPPSFAGYLVSFIIGMSVLIYLAHRGVPGSIHAIVVGGIVLTSVVIYSLGSVLVPTSSVYLVLIMIAAILMGRLGILLASSLSLAMFTFLLWLQINGTISPAIPNASWFHLGTYAFFVVATAILSNFIVTQIRKSNRELAMRLQQNEELQAELLKQALHDPLTGLYNRRYLTDMLEKEFARCQRDEIPLSAIVVDIDLFKSTNDTFGHTAGDAVLVSMAEYFSSAVRASDFCCRYGGEEFVLIMPGVDKPTAVQRGEEFRAYIAENRVLFEGRSIEMTASFGVATFPTDSANIDDLLNHADAALYKSKQTGRNKVSGFQKQA